MVAVLDELLRSQGKRAVIEFTDGEVLLARVLKVDIQEHEDVTFDVERVLVPGKQASYDRRNVYVAPLSDVKSVLL